MRFDVVTLFPEIFDSITKCGITARAMKRGLWSCHTWNPRAMTEDVHRTVDDRPFGGGPGTKTKAGRNHQCAYRRGMGTWHTARAHQSLR